MCHSLPYQNCYLHARHTFIHISVAHCVTGFIQMRLNSYSQMKHISTLWLMEMTKNRKKNHERENTPSLYHNYCLIQNVAVGVGIIELI